MTTRQFTITRTFDAPRTLVWRAWTDPSLAAEWWHPTGFTTDAATLRIDLREGGEYGYVMTSPDGEDYPTGGRYLAVRAPEHLRFTWGEPGDDDAPVITIDLAEIDGDRTEMTFHVAGIDADLGADDSVHDGWMQAFDALDATLAAAS